jgi:hypothetical protein
MAFAWPRCRQSTHADAPHGASRMIGIVSSAVPCSAHDHIMRLTP